MSVLEVLALLLLALVLPLIGIAVRRRLLQRSGGTVEMSLRTRLRRHGGGWVLGVGRFEGEELTWWRVFSLSRRPRRRLCRSELQVLDRREPEGGEKRALLAGAVVMRCVSRDGEVELAMDPSAVTGFLSWLEASPPGANLPVSYRD